jgi:hypothetical protein
MRHFCTLADENYLDKALAMYESLEEYMSEPFSLHFLAASDEALKRLSRFTHKTQQHLSIYNLEELKDAERDFQILCNNHKANPNNISPYHYALASFFTFYLFKHMHIDHCLYTDADIMFYRDPFEIFQAMQNRSVGLITHKHRPFCKGVRDVGYYNVGIIFFNNDNVGYEILEWWKDVVLHPHNPFAPIYNFCGDQKYLELFEELTDKNNIQILDYWIGHGAPWNFSMFEFVKDDSIIWNDPEHFVLDIDQIRQPLHFIHFSHFIPDYDKDTYKKDWHGEWGNILDHPSKENPVVRRYYDDYFDKLKNVRNKYEYCFRNDSI